MLVQQSKSSLTNSRKQHRDSYVEQFQLTQHQFQTQREQATHTSLHNNQTTNLKQSSSTELLGNLSIEFHINNPIREILYEFKIMLNGKGYKCIEILENQMYIVRMRLMDKLKKLFACVEPPKYLLQIRTHEFRSVRTVTIKPLQVTGVQGDDGGDTTRSRNTPGSFHQASDLLEFLSSSTKLNKPLTNEQLNQLDCDYKQDIYSLDATANFMFSRMLVDTNYTIGKRIAQVVNQFRDNKKGIQELKFVELLWMNKAISEVTHEMLQGFNCSRKELYEILGYCRKSIESYFYRCIEQNQIEMATDKQRKKLQQNIPQKDNSKHNLGDSIQENARRQLQLLRLYPVSMKHLRILNTAVISIQIYEQLFSLSEFIKIETQSKQLGEDKKGEFLQWVKERYGERIMQKLKALRAAGFGDKCFERFIKDLKLQE